VGFGLRPVEPVGPLVNGVEWVRVPSGNCVLFPLRGGTLTASEKKQVNKEQNQASRNIYRKKHNAATQGNVKTKQ
jgi:hypothetical protein